MMEPLKTKRPTFTPDDERPKRLEFTPDCDYFMDSARIRVRWALEPRPSGELDAVSRGLLEAVKHIDNARKMLRKEKTP